MIAAGVVLFLANLDLLPISVHQVWKLWPLVFVAVGLGKISHGAIPSAFIVGGLFAVFGVIFTLVNLNILRVHFNDDSWPLSMVFIALGIGGLAKVFEAGNPRWRGPYPPRPLGGDPDVPTSPPWPTKESWSGWSRPTDLDESPILDNVALMASVKRRVESQNYQGGTLTAFWGSIEIDLRRSRPPEGRNSIIIDANAVMGSIKLRNTRDVAGGLEWRQSAGEFRR